MKKRMEMTNGFDWSRITWSRHDSPAPAICSYCQAGLGDVPITMWRSDGAAVSFCDKCVKRYMRLVEVSP
jgi:hypothetical protein